jgi:hypothetical protein
MADASNASSESGGFRFVRAGSIGFSVLFLIVAFWATWILYTKPLAIDFLSYWAASRLVLTGHVPSVYNLTAHNDVELLVAPIGGLLPFAYPPPFLLVVTPVALAPFWLAFFLWLAVTASIYALVVGGSGRLSYAMAHPSVLANFLIGQNGFLTTSIMAGGLRLLPKKPFAGGAVLGLLVIKPQLALALPFAMLAGRQWRAIGGGILTAALGLLIGYLAFGWVAYEGFFRMLPVFTDGMEKSLWPWEELASPFASLRFLGVPQAPALVMQAAVALVAIGLVCRAWWLGAEERGPILAAATLLVPPYLFTYDALLLVIPTLWLIERRRHLWSVPVIWLFCFLPIADYFGYYSGPNTVPLAAMLCIWAVHSHRRSSVNQQEDLLAVAPV